MINNNSSSCKNRKLIRDFLLIERTWRNFVMTQYSTTSLALVKI